MTHQSYYRARRTPDGPLVTRHDPDQAEPLVLPELDYEWGKLTDGTIRLALELIVAVTDGLGHVTHPDTLAGEMLATLPEQEWTLSCNELLAWLDRRYLDEGNPF